MLLRRYFLLIFLLNLQTVYGADLVTMILRVTGAESGDEWVKKIQAIIENRDSLENDRTVGVLNLFLERTGDEQTAVRIVSSPQFFIKLNYFRLRALMAYWDLLAGPETANRALSRIPTSTLFSGVRVLEGEFNPAYDIISHGNEKFLAEAGVYSDPDPYYRIRFDFPFSLIEQLKKKDKKLALFFLAIGEPVRVSPPWWKPIFSGLRIVNAVSKALKSEDISASSDREIALTTILEIYPWFRFYWNEWTSLPGNEHLRVLPRATQLQRIEQSPLVLRESELVTILKNGNVEELIAALRELCKIRNLKAESLRALLPFRNSPDVDPILKRKIEAKIARGIRAATSQIYQQAQRRRIGRRVSDACLDLLLQTVDKDLR